MTASMALNTPMVTFNFPPLAGMEKMVEALKKNEVLLPSDNVPLSGMVPELISVKVAYYVTPFVRFPYRYDELVGKAPSGETTLRMEPKTTLRRMIKGDEICTGSLVGR